MGETSENIRIRMYRVGFGDCFLVSLPDDGKQHHLLIDCGVHVRGNLDTIAAAVDDIAKETGGEIALVVATHHHQDHISGFGECAAAFGKMHAGEVWLPWTEDPNDEQASRLKKKHMALVEHLQQHFAALAGARFAAVRAVLLNLARGKSVSNIILSLFSLR